MKSEEIVTEWGAQGFLAQAGVARLRPHDAARPGPPTPVLHLEYADVAYEGATLSPTYKTSYRKNTDTYVDGIVIALSVMAAVAGLISWRRYELAVARLRPVDADGWRCLLMWVLISLISLIWGSLGIGFGDSCELGPIWIVIFEISVIWDRVWS